MPEGMPVCPKCKGEPSAVVGCILCAKAGVISDSIGFADLLSNYTYSKVAGIEKTTAAQTATLATIVEQLDYIHGKVTAIWNAVKPG